LTEYSLSVDNLFVLVIVMASFNVPMRYQQEVLFVGIVLALVFRGMLITLAAVAIQQVSWVLYLLGFLLIFPACRMASACCRGGATGPYVSQYDRQVGGRVLVPHGRCQPGYDAELSGHAGAGDHRPDARARLHPRDLRAAPRPVVGVPRQRVRPGGLASAVLS